jgi:hypothetical protein
VAWWFRFSLSAADPFVLRCLNSPNHASVFTPRSSNWAGLFQECKREQHQALVVVGTDELGFRRDRLQLVEGFMCLGLNQRYSFLLLSLEDGNQTPVEADILSGKILLTSSHARVEGEVHLGLALRKRSRTATRSATGLKFGRARGFIQTLLCAHSSTASRDQQSGCFDAVPMNGNIGF